MEFSFKDILNIIKKNLIFIVVVSLVFALGSFFVTKLFIPKKYQAKVRLYVQTSAETSSSAEYLSAYNYAEQLVSTYIQMLDTNNFYSEVSQALNEKYTSSQIGGMVTFTSIEDTEMFQAAVTCQSPTEAKQIADAVAKVAPTVIEGISDKAELKIVDTATIPKNPISPNTTKNVLIAFLAGLVLSLVIAFIRDYFDVKIKYDDDMVTLANLPILAAIPDFELFANKISENGGGSASVKY